MRKHGGELLIACTDWRGFYQPVVWISQFALRYVWCRWFSGYCPLVHFVGEQKSLYYDREYYFDDHTSDGDWFLEYKSDHVFTVLVLILSDGTITTGFPSISSIIPGPILKLVLFNCMVTHQKQIKDILRVGSRVNFKGTPHRPCAANEWIIWIIDWAYLHGTLTLRSRLLKIILCLYFIVEYRI